MENNYIAESIGTNLLREYNRLLKKTILYQKHLESLENWHSLIKKGICQKCSKKTKTHLHHLNKNLISKNIRAIPLEIHYIPTKDIMYNSPEIIIKNYLEMMDVEKNIKYFSVKQNEILELCPKCHRGEHKRENGII